MKHPDGIVVSSSEPAALANLSVLKEEGTAVDVGGSYDLAARRAPIAHGSDFF